MQVNIRSVARVIAGVCFTTIYGHQALTVTKIFGFTFTTVPFLLIVLGFYFFVYLYHFQLSKQPACKEGDIAGYCERVKWFLAILDIFILAYTLLLHVVALSVPRVLDFIFEGIFTIIPDFIVDIITRWFNRK